MYFTLFDEINSGFQDEFAAILMCVIYWIAVALFERRLLLETAFTGV